MKKYVCLLGIIWVSIDSFSQNPLRVIVKDSASKKAVSNVSVFVNNKGKATNEQGFVEFLNLPDEKNTIDVGAVGYYSKKIFIQLPDTSVHVVLLRTDIVVIHSLFTHAFFYPS